ncbi:DNA polymerase III subunit epsilon [compost metagenome]
MFDGGNLHTADVDVLATLDVLEAMTRTFPEIVDQDLDALHRHQITAHRAWAENFNSWRQQQGYVGAGASTAWPS